MSDAPPVSETLTIDGHPVTLWRGGGGAPVVLFHDVFGPRWEGLGPRLARGRTVAMPALVGFPGSEYREDLDTIEDLAFWVMSLLESRGLVGADAVGEGFGGWVAAEVASRWPQTFRRLALVAPFGIRVAAAPPGPLFECTPAKLRAALFADPESAVAHRLSPDMPPTLEEFEDKLTCDRAAARFAWRPYLHNPKLAQRLARYTAPALVLWGAQDRLMPARCADAWKAALPQAEVAIVEGAGHALGFERPDAIGELIEGFLAR